MMPDPHDDPFPPPAGVDLGKSATSPEDEPPIHPLIQGDRAEDAHRAKMAAIRAAEDQEEQRRRGEQFARALYEMEPDIDPAEPERDTGGEPEVMALYWRFIPEIEPPRGQTTFQDMAAAFAAIDAVFPLLHSEGADSRARIALALVGNTHHVTLALFQSDVAIARRFGTLAEEAPAPVRPAPATPRHEPLLSHDEREALAAAAATMARQGDEEVVREPTQMRSLLIILAVLMLCLLGASFLYLTGSDTELRAAVAGTQTRIDAIDQRVDTVDNRTADLVTQMLTTESDNIVLLGQKKTLEDTLASLEGELGRVVEARIRAERRKDIDMKVEIGRMQARIELLQSELDRLREKEAP